MLSHELLTAWCEFEEQHEQDFLDWHTSEHMPERIGIPGFLRARRYAELGDGLHRHFILYELAGPEVLDSAAYRAKVNDPSPWTQRIQPSFRRNIRAACRLSLSRAGGKGPDIAVLWFASADRVRVEHSVADLRSHPDELSLGLHLGWLRSADGELENREAVLRADSARMQFDGMVLLEGADAPRIGRAAGRLSHHLLGLPRTTSVEYGIFRLSAVLSPPNGDQRKGD
ncbi:hypothetical protein [Sinomonas sp. P10A9]|uniref:Uncharacterized protein n=1 Tax=Sinomonas puerhi TaxID=3238584 RepID=A0AB39L7Z3_9MICC